MNLTPNVYNGRQPRRGKKETGTHKRGKDSGHIKRNIILLHKIKRSALSESLGCQVLVPCGGFPAKFVDRFDGRVVPIGLG